MSPKIKIIIAEDQELFRISLATFLKIQPEFEIVFEVSNGRELLEQLKQKHVDVVLLDTEMPVMDGKSALEIIKKRFPEVKVIILSFNSDMGMVSDFYSLGANSYMCKNCSADELIKAIKVVKKDGYYFDGNTSKALLDKVLKDKNNIHSASEIKFNDRETEILKRICDGKTNKEIATNMHLAASTIDFYRTRIYGKTKCKNVVGLLKYALKTGMVSLS